MVDQTEAQSPETGVTAMAAALAAAKERAR